jgi:hypothetical protein
MFVKSKNSFIRDPLDIAICRPDLLENPRWRDEGLPNPHCWVVSRLFEEAYRSGECTSVYHEARRVWWEAYWRRMGRYRGRHPFFESYIVRDSKLEPAADQELVLNNIVVEGFRLVPEEAKAYAVKLYRELFKSEQP